MAQEGGRAGSPAKAAATKAEPPEEEAEAEGSDEQATARPPTAADSKSTAVGTAPPVAATDGEASSPTAGATAAAPGAAAVKKPARLKNSIGVSLLKRSLEAIKRKGAAKEEIVRERPPPRVVEPMLVEKRGKPDGNQASTSVSKPGNLGSEVRLRRTEEVAVKRLLGLGLSQPRQLGKASASSFAPAQEPPSKRPRLDLGAAAMLGYQARAPRPKVPVDNRSRNLMGSLLVHLESAKRDFIDKAGDGKPDHWRPSPRVKGEVYDDEDEEEAEADEGEEEEEEDHAEDEVDEIDELQSRLEVHYETMKNFISTSAFPTIFYVPAKHTATTRKKLAETRAGIDRKIASLAVHLRDNALPEEGMDDLDEEDEEEEEEEADEEDDNHDAGRRVGVANGGVDPLKLFPQRGRADPRRGSMAKAAAAAAASVVRR